MQLQPYVRILLTFIAAALAVVVGSVHDETVRMVGSALVAGFAAVGIIPPHIPTRTSVIESEPVSVVKDESGYTLVDILMFLVVVVVLLILLSFFLPGR